MTTTTLPTVQRHRVEATATVTFDPDHQPLVTARRNGHLTGCTFALTALHLTVTAMTHADGTTTVSVYSIPEVARLVRDNGDGIDHSDWAFLTLGEDQYPPEVLPTLQGLRTAVHAVHPDLTVSAA